MKVDFKGLGTIFKKTVKGWNADDPFRQSAVIAYYAIFSLPALLVLVINVAGLFFGKEAVSGEIARQIEGAMGPETAKQVSQIVSKAGETKAGIISTILAVITIIFGATGVFIQLQKTLDQIWDVRQKPTEGLLQMLKARLFSFGLIVSIGFLLLVSLVISSLLAAASDQLQAFFPDVITYLFFAIDFIFSLVVISALFALMFKVLPDVKMQWRDVAIGSVLTGILFIIGKYGLSFYFGKADPASVYGATGSIVLILLWVSYSSMIVFFGAEFTKQYAVYHGNEILPARNAEKITEGKESLEQEHKEAEKKETAMETNETPEKAETNPIYAMKNKDDIKQAEEDLQKKVELDKQQIKTKLNFLQIIWGLMLLLFRRKKKALHTGTLMDRIKETLRIGKHPHRHEPSLK